MSANSLQSVNVWVLLTLQRILISGSRKYIIAVFYLTVLEGSERCLFSGKHVELHCIGGCTPSPLPIVALQVPPSPSLLLPHPSPSPPSISSSQIGPEVQCCWPDHFCLDKFWIRPDCCISTTCPGWRKYIGGIHPTPPLLPSLVLPSSILPPLLPSSVFSSSF